MWWQKLLYELTLLYDESGAIIWPNECMTQFWAEWPDGERGRRATATGLGGDLFRMREARRASDGSQRASRTTGEHLVCGRRASLEDARNPLFYLGGRRMNATV